MHRQDLTVVRKEVYGRQTRDGKHLGSNFRNIYFGNRASYVLWNGPKHLRMMRTGSWSPWGEWGWRVGIAMSSAAPTTAFSLRVDDNSLSVKWSSGGFFVICERPLMRFVFYPKRLECQQRVTTFQQEEWQCRFVLWRDLTDCWVMESESGWWQ